MFADRFPTSSARLFRSRTVHLQLARFASRYQDSSARRCHDSNVLRSRDNNASKFRDSSVNKFQGNSANKFQDSNVSRFPDSSAAMAPPAKSASKSLGANVKAFPPSNAPPFLANNVDRCNARFQDNSATPSQGSSAALCRDSSAATSLVKCLSKAARTSLESSVRPFHDSSASLCLDSSAAALQHLPVVVLYLDNRKSSNVVRFPDSSAQLPRRPFAFPGLDLQLNASQRAGRSSGAGSALAPGHRRLLTTLLPQQDHPRPTHTRTPPVGLGHQAHILVLQDLLGPLPHQAHTLVRLPLQLLILVPVDQCPPHLPAPTQSLQPK